MKRQMSVAGSFYPNNKSELENFFEYFGKLYESSNLPKANPKAIIVPHAGYIYSGFTADVAYRILQNSNPENILIIGPSHRVGFNGASIGDFDDYESPLGELESAISLAGELKNKFGLQFIKEAHFEHSTETQFPFVKHYLPNAKIIEIVYSKTNSDFLSEIINFALDYQNTCVVISTDLSHFYNLHDANILDQICLESVSTLDIAKLQSGCEACGKIGVEAMMKSAKKFGLEPHLLDYRTSADVSKDENRVVGYMSAYFE